MYDKHVATITSQTLWQVNKIGSWQATISFAGTSPPWVKSKKEKKKKTTSKKQKEQSWLMYMCTDKLQSFNIRVHKSQNDLK